MWELHARATNLEEGCQIVAVHLAQHVRFGKAHVCKQDQAHPKCAVLDDQLDSRNLGRPCFAVHKLVGALGRALIAVDMADARDLIIQDESADFHIVEERVDGPLGGFHAGAPGDASDGAAGGFNPLTGWSRDEAREHGHGWLARCRMPRDFNLCVLVQVVEQKESWNRAKPGGYTGLGSSNQAHDDKAVKRCQPK